MIKYKFSLALILLIGTTLAIVGYIYLRSPAIKTIKLVRCDDIKSLPIPKQLKQFMATKPGSELNVIYFDGAKLKYREEIRGDLFMQIYLTAMQKLIAQNYSIPKGYYIFSFRDGVHERFAAPWPVLAFAGSKDMVANKEVVLIPDPEAMQGYSHVFAAIDNNLEKYTWDKKIDKIFWRGVASGTRFNNIDMNGSPRLRFMNHAYKLKFADVGLTGSPMLIDDHFRQQLFSTHKIQPKVEPQDSIAYKYLIDIDGISCSYSRMAWILYSNSMLMKHSSDKVQWYYEKLIPYQHYVPIAEDFSDLSSQFDWAQKHPKQAQEIALNGRKLAQEVFVEQNVLQAFAEALIAYNQLLA
jgi:hypothetical protein